MERMESISVHVCWDWYIGWVLSGRANKIIVNLVTR